MPWISNRRLDELIGAIDHLAAVIEDNSDTIDHNSSLLEKTSSPPPRERIVINPNGPLQRVRDDGRFVARPARPDRPLSMAPEDILDVVDQTTGQADDLRVVDDRIVRVTELDDPLVQTDQWTAPR